ncbi:MAG: cytochrome c3 family protein [Myxococcota bacterium]
MNVKRLEMVPLPFALLVLSLLAPGLAMAQQEDRSCVRSGCHANVVRPEATHQPVGRWQCVSCHVPEAGIAPHPEHRGSVSGALSDPEDGAFCLTCHADSFEPLRLRERPGREEEPEGARFAHHAHGPVAEGRCSPCHQAHGPPPAHLLRGELPEGLYQRYRRSAYSACYGACHDAGLAERARTETATDFRNGEENLHYRHVVAPTRGRSCRLCHDPHRAANAALIRRAMPFGAEQLTLRFEATRSGGSCTTSCHMPVAYDRDRAIPSRMRVRDPSNDKEAR